MAIAVLTNAFISINGVTLSDHASQVTVNDNRNPVDITAFGASNIAVTKGLGDASISLTLFQDFAAGKVHATLQPLINSSTGIVIEVRQDAGARSATNPAWVMTGLLMNYPMLDGSVGEASTLTAEFVNSSQTGVQYLTA
jgi:hypothetical protein